MRFNLDSGARPEHADRRVETPAVPDGWPRKSSCPDDGLLPIEPAPKRQASKQGQQPVALPSPEKCSNLRAKASHVRDGQWGGFGNGESPVNPPSTGGRLSNRIVICLGGEL